MTTLGERHSSVNGCGMLVVQRAKIPLRATLRFPILKEFEYY